MLYLDNFSHFNLLPLLLLKLVSLLISINLANFTLPIILLIVLFMPHNILIHILDHGQPHHKGNGHYEVWDACGILQLGNHFQDEHAQEVSVGHF